MAKIASEINKPDGVFIVEPGTEADVLGPMQATVIPGVGPATAERLRRVGILTVEDLRSPSEVELVRLLGQSSGRSLHRMARADDDRPVMASRETKSVSVEDTFEQDISDRLQLETIIERMARSVSGRLRKNGLSGRTVTLKMRHHDFETHTRSSTLPNPTDNARILATTARGLLAGEDISNGLRLLGVGVSGLADWVQDDLFASDEDDDLDEEPVEEVVHAPRGGIPAWTCTTGPRRRLGVGLRPGSRHGPLRDPLDATRPRPHVRADDPALGAGHTGTFNV